MRIKRIKSILKYILVFIIPILIICFYLTYKEFSTGKFIIKYENFLLADADSQYNSIYAYIGDVFRGNQSIFYSFGKSLGGNMASTIGYYASSPFNILYLFCGKTDIPKLSFMIYLIKVGLSSLFMYIFLNYKLKKENSDIMFAIMYALCSYMAVYYFNSMWLDVVLLTPIVLLGLDRLINKNKTTLYTISLGVAVFSNFYIAYMLCIFCVIYFIYEILLKYKLKDFNKYKKVLFKFIVASVLGVGISCILLIPIILNLSQILRLKSNIGSFNILNIDKYIFDDFFAKLYIGSHNVDDWLSRNQANIYCGILPIVLNFYYYFNPKIKRREKILSFGVLLILIISLLEPHINYIWHGFSIPNGYIGRFSFLFSFYIIYIAAVSYRKLQKIRPINIIVFSALFVIINFIIYTKIGDSINFMSNISVLLTSVFFFVYMLAMIVTTNIKELRIKKMIRMAIYFLIILELAINYSFCFVTSKESGFFGSPSEYYNHVCPVINNLEDGFYRVDGSYGYSLLEPFLCNTMGIESSLSTNDGKLYEFMKNHGGSITYTTIFYDYAKLPILDSVFGIKYVKVKTPKYSNYLKEIKRIHLEASETSPSTVYIYQNPYALSLGYLIPLNNKEIYDKYDKFNSFESLNALMESLSGIEEKVLIPYKQKYLNNLEYEIYIDKPQDEIYLSFDYNIFTNEDYYFKIYVNDYYEGRAESKDIGIYKIINSRMDNKLKIKFINDTKESKTIKSMVAYHFDEEVFKKQIDLLKKHQLENIKIEGNKLYGDITADKDSTLFLSIPYDKGWKVYVDGKRVKYDKVAGDFIGINISKGKHKILMKYISPGFILGLIISIISMLLILADFIVNIRKCKSKKD